MMTYIKEIDTWDGDKVDDRKDNVASVVDAGDHWGRDLNDQEGEHPL